MTRRAAQIKKCRRSTSVASLTRITPSPTPNDTDSASYTFTAAIPSRAYAWIAVIAVAFGSGATAAVLSATSTVAGVTPAVVVQHNPTFSSNSGILIASIPAGVSGDLVVAFTTGTPARCAPVVYEGLGISTTAFATATNGTTDPTGSTLDIPNQGIALAVAVTGGTPTGQTWTGLTGGEAAVVETSRRYTTAASTTPLAAETGRTISCDWIGGAPATSSFAAASFAPA